MLRDSSAGETGGSFKRFFFFLLGVPLGLVWNRSHFPLIHLGLSGEVSSWNTGHQLVLQVGLFTAMCKHSAHTDTQIHATKSTTFKTS